LCCYLIYFSKNLTYLWQHQGQTLAGNLNLFLFLSRRHCSHETLQKKESVVLNNIFEKIRLTSYCIFYNDIRRLKFNQILGPGGEGCHSRASNIDGYQTELLHTHQTSRNLRLNKDIEIQHQLSDKKNYINVFFI